MSAPTRAQVFAKLSTIIAAHSSTPIDSSTLTEATTLESLHLESLTLAMIVFDIEDAFGIEISYNANEDVADYHTLRDILNVVMTHIQHNQTIDNAAARLESPFAHHTVDDPLAR